MKILKRTCLALLFALPLTSCGTTHLVRWANDEPSIYWEPTGDYSRGILKPFVTVVGFPVTLVWDVATFPFQAIMGTYPYGDKFMQPDHDIDI